MSIDVPDPLAEKLAEIARPYSGSVGDTIIYAHVQPHRKRAQVLARAVMEYRDLARNAIDDQLSAAKFMEVDVLLARALGLPP